MIDYIKGSIAELTPTRVVIEAQGIGYEVHIALTTYAELGSAQTARLYIHEVIREDAHLLYGFMNKGEREIFLLLMSVSGVGANTARLILSSYSAAELRQIIAGGNAKALNSIKGIGAKTAQRLIVDLKDKVLKVEVEQGGEITDLSGQNSGMKQEAVAALQMLGYPAAASAKVVDAIMQQNPAATIEQIIKAALKML